MRIKAAILTSLVSLVWATATTRAQSAVMTMKLEKDQIAILKTAPGITTRISFSGPPLEIICGDLYDPNTGKGNFVVQSSGNDVYLKPLAAKGLSNLFVKTAHGGENTYSFDLMVVPVAQAYRVVYIVNPANGHVAISKRPKKAAPASATPPLTEIITAAAPVEKAARFAEALRMAEVPSPPPPPLPREDVRLDAARAPHRSDGAAVREPVRRIQPDYPDSARQAGVQGQVMVEMLIDRTGKVVSARALSGESLLRPAAVSAARRWRYTPASPQDRGGTVVKIVTFDFRLVDRVDR